MFGGQFGLNKFSLGKAISDIPIRVFFTDGIKGVFGFGENIDVTTHLSETINGSLIVTLSTGAELNGSVFLWAKSAGNVVVVIENSLNETLNGQSNIAVNMQPLTVFSEEIKGKAYLSQDFQVTKISLADAVRFKGIIAKDFLVKADYAVILGNSIDVDVLEQIICRLNVTIPAGGILEIDSDIFTAYLNNQNVLHLHNGDWIFLDRDLVSLQFNDVGGNAKTMDITVFYNERYL